MHTAHVEEPDIDAKNPAKQLRQLGVPLEPWNWPAPQFTHALAPTAEYKPAAQRTHAAASVVGTKVPAAQLVQRSAPAPEYAPKEQPAQLVD